jgi:hypothetical protein
VPTGIKIGVSTSPCGVFRQPSRALQDESLWITEKVSDTRPLKR